MSAVPARVLPPQWSGSSNPAQGLNFLGFCVWRFLGLVRCVLRLLLQKFMFAVVFFLSMNNVKIPTIYILPRRKGGKELDRNIFKE